MYWKPFARSNPVKEIISSNYSIWIGTDSLSKLAISKYSKVAVLVDENTKKACLPILLKAKPELNNALVIILKSGEENKNITSCNIIWEALSQHNFDRDSLVINLGGGVIGDMGGFAASTYKRGVSFIQIPTTLLAMVDAAIGGKLGIDFNGLKNQIGLFNNPKTVLIHPTFLETLAKEQLISGFAEVIKHSLITDKHYWKQLITSNFNSLNWEEVITHSIKIKNQITLADPNEQGERKKLNFGHTYGHAIESYYLEKGNPILHGEAIALGIIEEIKLSKLSTQEREEINNFILSVFKLPTLPKKEELLLFMKNDKKNSEAKINFSLLDGIGSCTFNNLFLADEL